MAFSGPGETEVAFSGPGEPEVTVEAMDRESGEVLATLGIPVVVRQ